MTWTGSWRRVGDKAWLGLEAGRVSAVSAGITESGLLADRVGIAGVLVTRWPRWIIRARTGLFVQNGVRPRFLVRVTGRPGWPGLFFCWVWLADRAGQCWYNGKRSVGRRGAPAALQPALVLACASFLKALPGHTPAIPPEAFAATIQSVWPQADDFVIENLIQGLGMIAKRRGQRAD